MTEKIPKGLPKQWRSSKLSWVGALNLSIFRWINQWPEGLSPFLRFFSEALNYWSVKLLFLVLIVGMVQRGTKSRATVIKALIAVGLANGMTDLFKHLLPMHRPFQEFTDVILRAGSSPSMGTASAHSANMAAVAFVFTYSLRAWGAPWIAVALFTGFSRVYVGVHYPCQVLLGWTCGCLAGFLVIKSWDWILARRANVVES